MKFNLKNFPIVALRAVVVQEWKEGFEKELRDFNLEIELCHFAGYYGKSVHDKLKEILGE